MKKFEMIEKIQEGIPTKSMKYLKKMSKEYVSELYNMGIEAGAIDAPRQVG